MLTHCEREWKCHAWLYWIYCMVHFISIIIVVYLVQMCCWQLSIWNMLSALMYRRPIRYYCQLTGIDCKTVTVCYIFWLCFVKHYLFILFIYKVQTQCTVIFLHTFIAHWVWPHQISIALICSEKTIRARAVRLWNNCDGMSSNL